MPKKNVYDLHLIISKMPLEVCCSRVLPEFGIKWRDVSKAVRNARLPMTPTSVARILTRHVTKTLPDEDIIEIVSRLRLKLIATQCRTWHVIKLLERTSNEPLNILAKILPARVAKAMRQAKTNGNMLPEVQTVKLGDLIYISIQMKSELKEGGILYVAYPPGEPTALVSSLKSGLLQPCVVGLGFKKWEDACLHGRDVNSLLRISNNGCTVMPDHLIDRPYKFGPCLVRGGIDFTGRAAAEEYTKRVLGPNPPLLNQLTVTVQRDRNVPNKMKLTVQLKSENVANSLLSWASNGAIHPTSELFQVFNKAKSNKIHLQPEVE